MVCKENSCEFERCCIPLTVEPGYYCEVASQCGNNPYWQIIVVPILLGLLALAILLLVCVKLRKRKPEKYNVGYYAHEEM